MPPRIVRPSLVIVLSMFVALAAAALPSCGGVDCKDPVNAGNATCIAEKVLEDCTAPSWSSAILKYGPQVADIVHGAMKPDGSVDWSSIDAKLENAASQFGTCVVADVFGKLVFNKKAAVPGQSATDPSPADAKAEFDKLRAAHFQGHTFKTAAGTL